MNTDVRVAQYAVNERHLPQLLATECVRATGPVNPPNDSPNLTPHLHDPAVAEEMLMPLVTRVVKTACVSH